MSTFRKIEFDTNLFKGYTMWIDIAIYKNNKTILDDAKEHLISFLKTFNLITLYNYASTMQLVLPLYEDTNDILEKTSDKDTIYIYELI